MFECISGYLTPLLNAPLLRIRTHEELPALFTRAEDRHWRRWERKRDSLFKLRREENGGMTSMDALS